MSTTKGQHITMTDGRTGIVEDVVVVPTTDAANNRRRPKPKHRVLVRLDNKPSMVVKVAMSQVLSGV